MKNIRIILVLALIFGFYGAAQAGPFTDEMSKCLIRNTHEAEKTLFVQWMFAAMSLHPDVKPMSNISLEMRENLNSRLASMITKLFVVKCKSETGEAIKFEGASALPGSFGALGKTAVEDLMSDPKVVQSMGGFGNFLDVEKIKTSLGLK